MDIKNLKKTVHTYNLKIYESNLASLSWGNLSVILREKNILAIKPSGINMIDSKPDDISILNFKTKKLISGLKPSTDLDTHIEIYKNFKNINSICHTHSEYATIFSQLRKKIKCIGTTHSDHFDSDINFTRILKKTEVQNSYEKNTGKVIVERIKQLKNYSNGAILVSYHGPFTWGSTAKKAFENALVLEQSASMYFKSLQIKNKLKSINKHLTKFHFERKNGINKYYGQ